ncbi:galactose-1-phosphate uridylyltransferase [Hydrogenivirga sp.]
MSFFIREDPLTDDRRIIASVRSRRPHVIREVVEEEPFQCPFCAGNEALTPKELFVVKGDSGWLVRVIPNKFPAIPHMHDVVVDSPRHTDDLDTIEHLDKLLWTYKERLVYYYNQEGVRYVAVFRNRGKKAGASIPHPHSQVVAMPFYPRRYLREKEKYERESRNILGDFLSRELDLQERVLSVSKNFVVLMSYAPTTPYEVWIVPREKVSSFIFETRFSELAEVLRDTVSLLKSFLGENLPYNLTFQSAPPWDMDYHYYIRILPRVSVFGGFELETENIIVSVAPEEAVMELRAVKYAQRTE